MSISWALEILQKEALRDLDLKSSDLFDKELLYKLEGIYLKVGNIVTKIAFS